MQTLHQSRRTLWFSLRKNRSKGDWSKVTAVFHRLGTGVCGDPGPHTPEPHKQSPILLQLKTIFYIRHMTFCRGVEFPDTATWFQSQAHDASPPRCSVLLCFWSWVWAQVLLGNSTCWFHCHGFGARELSTHTKTHSTGQPRIINLLTFTSIRLLL